MVDDASAATAETLGHGRTLARKQSSTSAGSNRRSCAPCPAQTRIVSRSCPKSILRVSCSFGLGALRLLQAAGALAPPCPAWFGTCGADALAIPWFAQHCAFGGQVFDRIRLAARQPSGHGRQPRLQWQAFHSQPLTGHPPARAAARASSAGIRADRHRAQPAAIEVWPHKRCSVCVLPSRAAAVSGADADAVCRSPCRRSVRCVARARGRGHPRARSRRPSRRPRRLPGCPRRSAGSPQARPE